MDIIYTAERLKSHLNLSTRIYIYIYKSFLYLCETRYNKYIECSAERYDKLKYNTNLAVHDLLDV